MRFAAIVGTLDEADILPATLAQLRRIGVSMIVVLDHGSTDGTLDLLSREEERGDLWVLHPATTDDYAAWSAIEANLANEIDVDWVLFLDADEIPIPAGGTLASMDLDRHDVLSVPRYNVLLTPSGPAIPLDAPDQLATRTLLHARPYADAYHRMAADPGLPWLRGALEPKVMARPSAIAGMLAGDHGIATGARPARQGFAADLVLAHVPFRSVPRWERKLAHYRTAIREHPEWYQHGQGWHWVRWANLLDEGRAMEEFQRQMTLPDALPELRASGAVRSPGEILENPAPPLRSDADYDGALEAAEPWVTLAGRALTREGLDADLMLRVARGGQYPTVLMPPRHAVKLYGPWRWGHHTMDDEWRGLEMAGRSPDLPAPNLVARGVLDDDWQYLVETLVPGVSYAEVKHELDAADRMELAGWTGRWIRRFHAIPLGGEERAAGEAAFRSFIEDRHARAIAELTEGGRLPARLLAQLPGWLPPLERLLAPFGSVVPLHTDLHDEHVMVVRVDGRFWGSGVIDLNRFRLGHPLYELGPIWSWLWHGEPDLLARFVASAELPGRDLPDFPRLALAWCLLHAGVAQFPVEPPGIETVPTLDALAARAFGPIR